MATFFLHHFQFGSQLGSHNSLIVNTDLKKKGNAISLEQNL